MIRGLVLDEGLMDIIIRDRKHKGIDMYDEVWDGLYVIPSSPNVDQQELLDDLGDIFREVVKKQGLGKGYPGINVSDRRKRWEHNFRCPDVAVVLNDSNAVDCGTHFYLGPDFLVEIESPCDDPEEKIPFYSKIGVRELLIIHRDKRTLRLLRHDGEDLFEVPNSTLEGKQWLVSSVLPLAFRRTTIKGAPRTEIRRTDAQAGTWTI